MIPLPITAEEYAHHFRPSAEYLIVQRLKLDYENVRGIYVPKTIQQGMTRFIGVGRILAVSDYASDDESVEKVKAELRKAKYVGFEFHVIAECVMLPQFELPRDTSLVCMHVKDVVYVPYELDELLARQAAYEQAQTPEVKK